MKVIKYTILYCVYENFCDSILLRFRIRFRNRNYYGSSSDFLARYGSGSASQKVTVPTVPVPQRCLKRRTGRPAVWTLLDVHGQLLKAFSYRVNSCHSSQGIKWELVVLFILQCEYSKFVSVSGVLHTHSRVYIYGTYVIAKVQSCKCL